MAAAGIEPAIAWIFDKIISQIYYAVEVILFLNGR
jgi:hypothetical protein